MSVEKLEELERLFDKYGVRKKEVIQTDKKFLKVDTYKVELNNNQVIYRDKLIKNGGNGNAAVIVPLFDNDDIVMVVQPRVFASRGVLLDFPSGYIEKGEDIKVGALRELKEETGYSASSVEVLATYYQDEGITDSTVSIILARGLKKVSELELDKDEYLETYMTNFNDLDELVSKGYIKSGGSQLAIALIKLLKKKDD